MNKVFLFFATVGLVALTVLIGLNFVFKATQVSTDFSNASTPYVYTIETARISPGQTEIFRIDGIPFVVWRRDFVQQVQAFELRDEDFDVPLETLEDILQELRDTGHPKNQKRKCFTLGVVCDEPSQYRRAWVYRDTK